MNVIYILHGFIPSLITLLFEPFLSESVGT